MFPRRSVPSRFRGDRIGLLELLVLLALAVVIVMIAFDSVSWRVVAFFQDLISSA